jgi:hypothetical protein
MTMAGESGLAEQAAEFFQGGQGFGEQGAKAFGFGVDFLAE